MPAYFPLLVGDHQLHGQGQSGHTRVRLPTGEGKARSRTLASQGAGPSARVLLAPPRPCSVAGAAQIQGPGGSIRTAGFPFPPGDCYKRTVFESL